MKTLYLHCLNCLANIPPGVNPHQWSKLEASLIIEEDEEVCKIHLECVRCGQTVANLLTMVPAELRDVCLCGMCGEGSEDPEKKVKLVN